VCHPGEVQRHTDYEQAISFVTHGDQWLGYEDPDSVAKKVDKNVNCSKRIVA